MPCKRLPVSFAVAVALSAGTTAAGDSVRRYGGPTPGSGGIAPTVWVNAVPRPGDPGFKLVVERTLGGTWAFPFVAPRAADFTHAGLRLLIDPSVALYGGAWFMNGSGPGNGRGDIPLPLPASVHLIGQPVHVQAFTLDDFAPNPLGLAASAGLRLVPALPAQLLVMRTLAGSPDAQGVIDLAANRVIAFGENRFADGRAATFAPAGRLALAIDPVPRRMRVFDCTTVPPVWWTDVPLAAEGTPEHVTLTPDASRAYVVHTGAAGMPPIEAFDVRDGPGFGQPWPGPPIRLAGVGDACGIAFDPDSRFAFVAARGTATGTPGSVSLVDVRPGSPTFHQQLARLEFPGRQATAIAIAGEPGTVFVPLVAPGRSAWLARLDAATFTPIDADPGTPGIQHLGGEVSLPRTPLPDVLGPLAADPRGEELYCGAVGAIVRVGVDPASPSFRRVVAITDNVRPADQVAAILLSDAGDRLYAITPLQVVEIDLRTLLSPRGWSVPGAVGLAFR
jgi:hypothetical protein